MNELQQLTRYINRMVSDNRLKPVHISLSVAVCHSWISSRFQRSCRISRSRIMKASRIRSKATYHKTLKDLQAFGYLRYTPSYHPIKASEVMILDEPSEAAHRQPESIAEAEQNLLNENPLAESR